MWEHKEIIVNDKFSFAVAIEIMNENDLESQNMDECQQINDWPKYKDAIQA